MVPFWAIQDQRICATAPAGGACREGHPKRERPRQEELSGTAARSTRPRQEELAGKADQGTTRDLLRRATRPSKDRRATSSRARQGINRGKALAAASHHPAPALQLIHPRVALGPFQAYVARGCAARSMRWQSNADRVAVVANGGAPDGPFPAPSGRRRWAFNALVPCRQS